MRMVMISLGCSWVKRMRWRCPDVSKSWCHFGANCCQKSSTEQNSSSILIVEPPGIDTESLLFYHTRWVPYPELTLFTLPGLAISFLLILYTFHGITVNVT